MITVEYNMDEAAKGGIGCVLFTTGGVTVAKHEDGALTAEFIDEDGGCITSVWMDKRVLLAMLQLSDHPAPTAVMQLEPEESPRTALLLQQLSERDGIIYPF